MIPYTDEEMDWLSDRQPKQYRKSNTNRQRRVETTEWDCQGGHWFVRPKRSSQIQTTIEVDGVEYTVPVQL